MIGRERVCSGRRIEREYQKWSLLVNGETVAWEDHWGVNSLKIVATSISATTFSRLIGWDKNSSAYLEMVLMPKIHKQCWKDVHSWNCMSRFVRITCNVRGLAVHLYETESLSTNEPRILHIHNKIAKIFEAKTLPLIQDENTGTHQRKNLILRHR